MSLHDFPLPFLRRLREHSRMPYDVNAPAWRTSEVGAPPEFASVTSLGAFVRVYAAKEHALLVHRPLAILGGAFVGIGIAIAVIPAIFGGLRLALEVAALPCGIGGVVFALYLLNMRRMRRAASCVVVYDAGFATLVGSRVGVWPWAEITSVVSTETTGSSQRGTRRWTTRCYALSTRTGDTVILLDDWFDDVRPIIAYVKGRVFALLRPPLQSAYASGAPVSFGAVTVSKEAIESNGRRLAWGDVRDVVVKEGLLIVTPTSGSPLKVRVSRIPNVEVLGTLIGVDPAEMHLAYI